MHHLTLARMLKFIYPYWVIARVITLVVGSLAFLILHETLRYMLYIPNASARRKLNYVNRAG